MKNQEFYRKYKTVYPAMIKPWYTLIIIGLAILLEPLLMYKNFTHVPFSVYYYLEQIVYFLPIGVPMGILLFWVNWREWVKRSKGFFWIGKFEVIKKQASFTFYHLLLSPGDENKIRVNKKLFDKTQVGDLVIIRRDSLGGVDEVRRINNFLGRLKTGH